MKFIFVINPAAGPKDSEQQLLKDLKKKTDLDYDIYYTKGPHDATQFVKTTTKQNPEAEYCFVACGGDGTINEVINGLVGDNNSCFTVYPCGSGNDYVKYFGGAKKFLDLDNLINGTLMNVDVMCVDNHYSINVVNFGFDCHVVKVMQKVKRMPLIGGKNAYTTGIVKAVFTGMRNQCKVYADGELLNPDGELLLCTLANGDYVGGSYKCAPRSVIDDGLMEVCLAKVMPFYRFIPLVDKYKNGVHLDDEGLKDVLVYRRAKKVELISPQPMDLSIDGEVIVNCHYIVENLEKKLKFLQPK